MNNESSADHSSLSQAKKDLINKIRLAKQSIALKHSEVSIKKRINPELPSILSFSQQRLWFLEQLEGSNAAYNMPCAIQLDGPLNLLALEHVFQNLRERHESLRTNFVLIDGNPLQKIHQTTEIDIDQINLENLESHDKKRTAYEHIAKEFSQAPFDLTHDNLLRLKLVRFHPQQHILLFVIHHIISDGWSNGNVLLREICTLYSAFSQGKASPLIPLEFQYADFALWQRSTLAGPLIEQKIDYWVNKLKGTPSLLELPLDFSRPAINSFSGKTKYFSIEGSTLRQLKDLGKSLGTSLYVVLQAAFSTLLFKYSRQETIVVGSPIANRSSKELEGLIGLFVNTFVIRTDFSSHATCVDIIKQARENFIESHPFQDLPFERLVEAIRPERNSSFSPLFQVMFILQNQNDERGNLKIGDLSLKVLPLAQESSMFDITLKLEEQENQLFGELEYSTDLFKESTIRSFIAHFKIILDGFISNPNQSIASLSLLNSGDYKKIISDFNQTKNNYQEFENVCTLFEKQVKECPDRIAIFDGQEQISYQELNLRSSKLASYLSQAGAGNEVLVGLCLQRSINLIVGILGILKSGAAYVPIDPSYPLNRIEDMIDAANINLILTEFSLDAVLNNTTLHKIKIDTDWNNINQAVPTQFLFTQPENLSERLAYVIFTSGSTGKPKGVQISHSALYNFLQSMLESPSLNRFDSLLAVTTISFDIAALEIYLPLISGARIILAPKETSSDSFALSNLLLSTQASVMQATPATWRLLLTTIEPEQFPLKMILCGGEALTAELASRLIATDAQVWNMYGPTETSIWSTQKLINNESLKGNSNPSIGRPIANTEIFIFDQTSQVTPIGIPGHLYIGGLGLSRGYLNQPAQTAERFRPSPFGQSPGQRIYQTGDIARFVDDGDIEYIERADLQIKIRGFRIELGEIESVLARHPAIKNVVAVCQQSENDQPTLNAFFETVDQWEDIIIEDMSLAEDLDSDDFKARSSNPISSVKLKTLIRDLYQSVATKLPSYMLPTNISRLEKLPLTPNGKIDRKSLPKIKHVFSTQYLAPRSVTEESIHKIWSGLLNVEQISVNENFFHLGGHSLMAVQVASKIRDQFAVQIPIQALFDNPTVAQLSSYLEANPRVNQIVDSSIKKRPDENDQEFPLSFSQKRLWFLDQLEGPSKNYLISIAVKISGHLIASSLDKALVKVIQRHAVLRSIYLEKNGQPTAHILPSPNSLLTIQKIPANSDLDSEINQWLLDENSQPINLSLDLPIRASLLEIGVDRWVLAITVHHIAADESSMIILQQELMQLYIAEINDLGNTLPQLTLDYADYAVWQQRYLTTEILNKQLSFWKTQLQGAPKLLNLPIDKPRPASQRYRGQTSEFLIDASLTHSLKKLCHKSDTTLFMSLLACYGALLAMYTNHDDIVIGTPITHRNRSELNGLIGFFVNTLPIRLKLNQEMSSMSLLGLVRKTILEGFNNQDAPFESIVEVVHPERSLSHAPIFQTMFVLQNAQEEESSNAGLTLMPIKMEISTAKFDLTLSFVELAGTLQASWEYNTDLFEDYTIEQLSRHFVELLKCMVDAPNAPILHFPLIQGKERQKLLSDLNPSISPQHPLPIEVLIEVQANIQPDAIALSCNDSSLSYSQFNQEANKLAHALRKLNIGPETIVSLFFDPSLEMIIGMLGTLKTGAAYLPILPNTPVERVADILEESNTKILLCSRNLRPVITGNIQTYFIEDLLSSCSSSNNPICNKPEDSLAYVIYTSGSSGKPKGVGVSRINLASYIQSRDNFYQEKVTGLLLLQPFGFDIASGNIFWTLSQGGTLYLEQKDLAGDPLTLLRRIQDTRISHLVLLPLLYKLLLDLVNSQSSFTLEHVTLGGESLPADLARDHYVKLPNTLLTNEYGPTETTIMCTAYTVPKDPKLDLIPIGMPVCNAHIYLLNPFLELGFPNVGGEVTIGGMQVSRGYLNQPALTAEKFIPDPYSKKLGARLYRSGDFARYRVDGQLLFQGRKDNQVKIRGFRIELSEIENALLSIPGINSAYVIITEDKTQGRIYAYVVLSAQSNFSGNEIQLELQKVLPDYMLPAGIHFLDQLPYTINGKLDLAALPSPKFEDQQVTYAAPRNQTEAILCRIWEEVLGASQVGINDNFFNLGGDSILSIQIISRANQSGLSLSVKQLFQQQTIALLAGVATPTDALITAPQGIIYGSYSLSPIQHWFFETFQGDLNHFNQSIYLEINHSVQPVSLKKAFGYIVKHHDLLRSTFTLLSDNESGFQASITSEHDPLSFEFHDYSALPEFDQNSQISSLANKLQSSLNIAKGELLRVTLFKIGNDKPNKLLLISHHLVVDGISWRILLEDLDSLLEQLESESILRLPAKTMSFPQWTDILYQYANNEALEDLEYWQKQQIKQKQIFPTDFEYEASQNNWGSTTHFEITLNASLTKALLTEVPQAYRTQINDILLSALAIALNQWSSLEDFEIAIEGHGREEIVAGLDISRTVGWFTSTFPLKLKYFAEEPIGATILRIKEQLRNIPKNGISYGLLRYLNSSDSTDCLRQALTYSPISFNYLGQFNQTTAGKFLLGEATGDTGSDFSQSGSRQALIDLNARISANQFNLQISYSKNVYRHENIKAFGDLYLIALTSIIHHCSNEAQVSYTSHDFPLATLSASNYDALYSKYQNNIQDIYPLSPMQQGMVFHTRFNTSSGAYIIQMGCRMAGNFSPTAFQSAWATVIQRHPSLRTVIYEDYQTQDYQLVLNQVSPSWHLLDWTHLSTDDQDLHWDELLIKDRFEEHALDSSSQMRFYLAKTNHDGWRFLWSHHHLMTDGWCLPIIMKEVLHFYAHPEQLDLPLPNPYRDYIEWLGLQNIEDAKNYWTNYLQGLDAPTPLGITSGDFQINQSNKFAYQNMSHFLSEELSGSLNQFAKKYRFTLSNLMQATWALLLGIYSQTNDVVFGATVSGRPPELKGVENMVGLFINSLPVRAHLHPEKNIQQFLLELMENQLESDHYSYTPLVTIQSCSEISQRLPLFDSILIFENYPLDSSIDVQAEALSIGDLEVYEQTHFPIAITVSGGEQIPIKVTFNEALIPKESIRLLLNHFENLLQFLSHNPNATLSEWMVNALTKEESYSLVETLNETKDTFPEHLLTLSDLFEAQVNKSADKIAVSLANEQLTYFDLNRLANQLARKLQGLGAKPGDLIGVCLNRSPLLVVALIAIQKIGAAYVPIDPDYPNQRINYMIEDSQIKIVLIDEHAQQKISATPASCLLLMLNKDVFNGESSINLNLPRSPLLPAYVIYTSGSTGKPKGVQISQLALVNFLLSMKEKPGIVSDDKLLSVTTISFDIAGLEIYLPLINGNQLILVDKSTASDGASLLATIHNSGATIMQATPITWRILFEAGWNGVGLKQIWCGGEPFPLDLVSRFEITKASVWNLYGPTETTIWSTRFKLFETKESEKQIPIGQPISNTQVLLLDSLGNLLPKAVAGQLFIGGKGLANGYLNRPGLTAEKFTPNPFGVEKGSRIYATGDIARYRIDNHLICLGRIDQQIKLRGFRIEPGEIEATIQHYSGIRQVILQVLEFAKDDQRLVAYLLIDNASDFILDDLLSWTRTQLPQHMIPSEWIVLDSLPLTPNGKLDKKALPHPTHQTSSDYIPPATATEQTLEKFMAEVLSLNQVSVVDDFFNLGGHSLLATKLAARIQDHFQLNIPLPILFEKSNIRHLGEYIDNLTWTSSENSQNATPLNDEEEHFTL